MDLIQTNKDICEEFNNKYGIINKNSLDAIPNQINQSAFGVNVWRE